jgi:hypothetical protein
MTMLPGFDTIPEVAAEERPPEQELEYYVRMKVNGEWWFLWKSHDNGGCEWGKESEIGRKKPIRFKTIGGAQRRAAQFNGPAEVGIWARG